MPKWRGFAFTTLMLVMAALPVCAEAVQAGTDTFFDWGYLATYSGAVAAVVFIVQFLKLPIDRIGHVPTRVLVYFVSLAVLLLAHLFTAPKAFNVEVVALAALNAVIVAFAAMGIYERMIALPESVKKGGTVEAARQATEKPFRNEEKDEENDEPEALPNPSTIE